MSNVYVFETVLAAAVDTNDTIDFAYSAGVAQADIASGSEVMSIPALQNVLSQSGSTFTVAYDSDSATVTYKGSTTIPANSTVRLQVNRAVAEDPIDAVSIPPATTSARGGVKQAAAQTNSAAADTAAMVVDFNALLAKLRTAGILAS